MVRATLAGIALFGYATGCSLDDAEPSDDNGGASGATSAGRGGSAGSAGVNAGRAGGGSGGTAAGGGGAGASAGGAGGAGSNAGGAGNSAGIGGNGGDAGFTNTSGAGGSMAGTAGSAGATAGAAGNAGASGAAGAGGAGGTAGASGAAGGGGTAGAGGSGPGAFDPCPSDAPCKILPLGDSITDGFNVAGGYRIKLFQNALDADKQITFVGGSMNGPNMVGGVSFPRAHEGHSGWTIAQIDGIVPSPALSVDPHIILLLIGTNDMYGSMPATAGSRLEPLLDQILEASPDALLAVGTITPLSGNGSMNIPPYNTAVKQAVEERAAEGKHIILVDQFDDFPNNELADGVHPNQAGYNRMADVWFEAIADYLH